MKYLLLSLCILASVLRAAAIDLYVGPGGSDANPGSAGQPLATLAGAQNAVRLLGAQGGLPIGGVSVWFAGGYYNLTSTALFGSADSGSAASPIVYASLPGQEAHLTGAVTLDPSWFSLVNSSSPVWGRLDSTAQGNVYQVDLYSHGIGDLGTLKPRGFGLRATAPLELFFNGQPMTLARWPNVGQSMTLTGSVLSPTQITYAGSRPARWTLASDVWMHGLWGQDWADFHIPVSGINTSAQTITFASPPAQFGIGSQQPYYAYNLLEELDTPGEYYVDRSTGILYFWPAAPLSGSILQASQLESSLIAIDGANYITFRGLVIEASRGPLLTVTAGDHIQFDSCVLRNAGQFGAQIAGTNNGVTQSQIGFCGEEGVRLEGGDRPSLAPGNNYVDDTRIHGTGRASWTYKPGISFEGGCGNSATHNLLDDMPHAAVLFSGNNHLIAYNEIWHVCQVTSDAGAIYAGRDWGFRGNTIAYNYLHDIDTVLGTSDVNGVYLDDCVSGVEVMANIFYNIAGTAIFCGGGRDTIMEDNVIALCGIGHYNDNRGRSMVNDNPGDAWNLLAALSAGGILYQQGAWAASYPACAAIPNSWPILQTGLWLNPQNCIFSSNAGWSNAAWTLQNDSSGTGVFSVYADFSNNNSAQPALFGAAAAVDRSQRPAAVMAAGLQALPFGSIGPDASSQPAPTLVPPAPTLTAQSLSPSQIELDWFDNGGIWSARTAAFEVQQQDATSGAWTAVQSWGSDVDFSVIASLAASTTSAFRLRAYNANGSSYSNAVSVTTGAAPAVAGASVIVEAENPLIVVADMGINGTVGVSPTTLDSSAGSVRMYDAGDAIQINFTVSAPGQYRLGVRVRSGGTTGTTSLWPNGYLAQLDGAAVALAGDTTSISALDPSYGGCFWGTMDSAALTLAAGPHSLVVTAEESWEVVEYLEVTTLISATTAPTSAAAAVFGTNADIGSVATAGTSSFANGIYTLTDSGGDIWNPAVAFQYDYQTMIGDGSITVRVSSLTNTDPWAKAGVMMRQSLDPEDLFTAVYATPGNGVVFQGLPSAGASDFSSGVGATAPCWVRLTRSGNSFSSSTSTDGIAWTPIQTITIAMSAQVYVGLAVCSHNLSEVATATFDSLTLAAANSTGTSATTSTATTTATTSTPTPTTGASATAAPTTTTSTPTGNPSSTPTAAAVLGSNADIGSVATAGTSAQANGVYTLTDSGADIWDATVAFQYDYQAMTGDGSITVRVASLQNTDSWAKAGIMIRQSLDPLDVFAAVYETPGNGVAFQGCPTIGASDFSSSGAGTAPAWVRLTRAGNLFNAYSSTDGTDWTLIGAAPIAMSTSVYVGLVVSSHNPYAVATATFDSLSVTPGL